jgi:glutamate racemase
VPIVGVILPGVEAALEATRNRRIGVIGTSATIRSMAYSRAILARDESANVFCRACPLLVPLVEEGWIHHPVTRMVLQAYLAPLLRRGIDTLVLGCTHYPLLKSAIRRIVGHGVTLVDSGSACAGFLVGCLEGAALVSRHRRRSGVIQPFVTDEVERFGELSRRFLGVPAEPAWKIDLQAVPTDPSPRREARRKPGKASAAGDLRGRG